MRRQKIRFPRLALINLLILTVMHGIAGTAMAAGSTAHHDIAISLFPEKSELEGRDRIRIQRPENGPVVLLLSPRARIQALHVNGREHPYKLNRGRLTLHPERIESALNLELSLQYSCRFDDPAPVRPLNTDNPGFGVSGTISVLGTFILSGAGWYPRVADARESFDLRVDGPADTVAVTAGRLAGIDNTGKRTISRWQIDNPAFWAALRDLYQGFLFKHASWKDLLFIGLPDHPKLAQWLPRELALSPGSFQLEGQRFDKPADVLFLVSRHPDHSGNTVSLLHPLTPVADDPAMVKIPHYGRYSFLAFSDGRNRVNGWPANWMKRPSKKSIWTTGIFPGCFTGTSSSTPGT